MQAADRKLSNYYFSHITGENGLSQSNVKAILQDSYGFMWFGTKNGLNRFDGTGIVQMNCYDYAAGTGNQNISALFEDQERKLWVGTDRGVYRYDPAYDRFCVVNLKTDDGIDMNNWVADIAEDRSGNIWVVIPDQGIFRYRDGRLRLYDLTGRNNIKAEAPDCICVRSNGEVWVGTWGVGLFRYNEKADRFERHGADGESRTLQGKNICAVCDYGDRLAIAVHEGEVMLYDPATGRLEKIDLPEAARTFVRTVKYFDGILWVGTHEGLFLIDEPENTILHLKEDLMRPFSLSDKIIYTLYRDKQGGIWIGTMFGGVNYLPRQEILFDKYVPGSDPYTLNTKRIRELAEDAAGNIWIGTENDGINILDTRTGKITQLNRYGPDAENRRATLSLYAGKDFVVCGLFKQGLDVIRLPEKSVRHYGRETLGIGEGSVYSFYIDSRGERWIGTGWALYRSGPGAVKFTQVEEIGYDWIFDTFEDRDGTLWFASMGSGLWKYTPATGIFRKYIHREGDEKSLSSNSVSSVMQDSRGRLWISTDRGGICRYNPETDDFTTFSIRDGLPDNVAYKILEDEKHHLWFGTNRGLVRFDPATADVRIFTTKDGLPGNQFNYKSALKGNDGKFYFGSIDGLIAFDPNSLRPIPFSPPVYISKFSVNNREVTVHTPDSPLKKCISHTDKITLPYNRSNVSFDIALLSYSAPQANRYYYKMEPLDKDWIKAPSNRNISYAQLPPGTYTLRIRATHLPSGLPGAIRTPAGQPDEPAPGTDLFATRSLEIVVLPPWWQSSWAYCLYAIAGAAWLLGGCFWYKRRQEKRLEERQRLFEIEKEKELYESKVSFFTEIAHEVRTPLTLINGPLEAIEEMEIRQPKLARYLEAIGQNTRRLLDLTGQLLDFQKIGARKFELKFECVDITSLLDATVARFEPTIRQKKKELLLNIPDERLTAAIDREAITKIISNLLNNALKYARQTILVELTNDANTFTVRVVSDGDKIPAEAARQLFEPFYQMEKKPGSGQAGVGIGLPLARSLATLHKGCLYLDTEQPDNTFVLTLPRNEPGIRRPEETLAETVVSLPDEETATETENLEGHVLLLAEDNENMLSFLRERLEETFAVETARNGQEALNILHEAHIDLVISDIMMPIMNGYELGKAMKSDGDLCHIPLIFLTAKNDLESKISGLKIGAEAYIEKPFPFSYLKTQIVSLLSNRRKEREAFSRRPFFPVHQMQMNRADQAFMDKVIRTIQDNLSDENFNVERMADLLCMSRSSLLRKIKFLFNLSPVDFIRLIRLKKAAELIQQGKYRIGDICYMVGINSPSYFSKMFLRQFGVTPKEFEKQQQGRRGKRNPDLIINKTNGAEK